MTTLIDESGKPASFPAWGVRALPHARHPKIGNTFKVPVQVLINDSRLCGTVLEARFWIIARSAKEAANWARDRLETQPETEIRAWGIRGGEVHRFVGWQSAIGTQLVRYLTDQQIEANLQEVLGVPVNQRAPDEQMKLW